MTSPSSPGRTLSLLPQEYVVTKFPIGCTPNVSWSDVLQDKRNSFMSLTITQEENSLILPANRLCEIFYANQLELVQVDPDWICYKVEGPLDLGLVGILHGILDPLKAAGISVLAVGTYDTDYFLVKSANLEKTSGKLREQGFTINVCN